jgi:hypothetical protein
MEVLSFPDALHFFSDSTIVASAMAVEMFLNLYGVVRLGEPFYKSNLERMGATQKVAALLGICCGVLVSNDDEIVQVTRRLFGRRNDLVHPKAKDLERRGRGQGEKWELPQQLAHDSVMDMERFATLFYGFDGDAIDLGGI